MQENEIDFNFLKTCLREAGQIALRQRGQMTAEIKADHTPVTEVDRQVEEFLVWQISARYPGHAILSEEGGASAAVQQAQSDSAFAWVIDPIDGTRAFASGLPVWGVSIGILRDGKPFAGGLYLPVTRELYWGNGREAFYNDRPIRLALPIDLNSPLVFLGVPSNFHLHFLITYPRIRSLGSTAAHLAYVATGAAVGALTRRVSLWDLAGMLPVLAAVGVEVAYLSGEPFQPAALLDGSPIREPLLIAHPSVMPQLRERISPMRR